MVLTIPGFLKDGIDFEQLVAYYLANNYHRIEITDQSKVNLIIRLMKYIIESTHHGYTDAFTSTVHGRFQIIFNSVLEELYLQKAGFSKRSNAVWSLTDTYEKGTDFYSSNGKQIEAKVYKDLASMKTNAKKGSNEYTVFHGADYVICYLINSHESKHWWWLKKINGIYDIYDNSDLNSLTYECLPVVIPICYCKLKDNKFIIDKNTFCL